MRYNSIDLTKCPVCQKKFIEGEPACIKKQNDNLFYILCERCWNKEIIDEAIKNKRNAEIKKQKTLELVNEDKLWRYMDLSKFISLLMTQSIFFSSPDQFSDKFEGAFGELERKAEWDDFYLSQFRASVYIAPDNSWHNVNNNELEKQTVSLLEKINDNHSKQYYISCWHCNDYESEAMWNMYSKNVENAIAIQTTYKKLKQQLEEFAEIKKVKYIDYNFQFANLQNPFWNKRKAFEYEHEVRAIHREYKSNQEKSMKKKVDLNKLIESVYVSPYATQWFFILVQDIVEKYGYNFDIQYSKQLSIPF